MMNLRRALYGVLLICLLLSAPSGAAELAVSRVEEHAASGAPTGTEEGAVERFDALATRYFARMEGREEAQALRVALEAEAAEESAFELWRSLFKAGIAPRTGASNALALLRSLVDGGDPARWESASGFFLPSFVPKPLAAADALYASALFLLQMEDEGAAELAGMLFERLLDSPQGKYFFVSTAPAEYGEIVRELTEKNVLPPFGRWTEGRAEGALPLAVPLRGRVTRNRALSEEMTFLNGAGQPVPNGMYAWDRKKGKIYTVVEGEKRFFWYYD